jgi:ABC-type transporter Mla maintaining outer membrane lipid asymmetry ATPase subunit MlaF/ABC-type transporter Mla maintaining outer membrane lipid asymmetry permease subunit MlaE
LEPLQQDHPVTVSLESLSVDVAGRNLLSNVSLQLLAGRITVIVGGSGAGKSVLLRILGGLVDAGDKAIQYSGRISIGQPQDDQRVSLSEAQPRVGIVFQNFALFDQWSPTGNVQFAIDHRSNRHLPPEQSATAWIEELRVPKTTAVSVLSGGQKQRLAIARTLAAAPAIVLYDEPTSGLDSASGRQVAELIRRTQQVHRRTSVIVTHDYPTLLPIADDILLLDWVTRSLIRLPREQWDTLAQRLQPVRQPQGDLAAQEPTTPPPSAATILENFWKVGRGWGQALDEHLIRTGSAILGILRQHGRHEENRRSFYHPGTIRPYWISRFFASFFRLVCGPSAIVYLSVAGLIIGFTATYFTFEFLPYRIYSKPLLVEDLLAAIGFALYRILVPVLVTILIAARCGAAVAADVGVKQYGSQIEALKTLGVRPAVYLLLPIVLAFLLATPLLNAVAFQVAKAVSLICFSAMHPELGPHFWHQHFHARLTQPGSESGFSWVMLKTVTCGTGIALISYYQGSRYKGSAGDVSDSITATVLWATLFVLIVHFTIALVEF